MHKLLCLCDLCVLLRLKCFFQVSRSTARPSFAPPEISPLHHSCSFVVERLKLHEHSSASLRNSKLDVRCSLPDFRLLVFSLMRSSIFHCPSASPCGLCPPISVLCDLCDLCAKPFLPHLCNPRNPWLKIHARLSTQVESGKSATRDGQRGAKSVAHGANPKVRSAWRSTPLAPRILPYASRDALCALRL